MTDLIPAEFHELLLQVRGAGDREFWTIGDVAAALCDEAEGNDGKKAAIRIAVAGVAGVRAATVRDYEACARFYPAAVRASFPALTRWHFRHAKKAGTLDNALAWLGMAVESADDYGGYPMPVDVLGAKMAEANGRGQPEPVAPEMVPLTLEQALAWAAAWKAAAKKWHGLAHDAWAVHTTIRVGETVELGENWLRVADEAALPEG